MDKYKRFLGVIIFALVTAFALYISIPMVKQPFDDLEKSKQTLESKKAELEKEEKALSQARKDLKEMLETNSSATKKVFAPSEADLGEDTLYFTLYNDLIEMLHANSVKIKSIKKDTTGIDEDSFKVEGNGLYYVVNVNLDLVSNYTELGKLIEDIYQYRYYIKINSLDVRPHPKDKKILLSKLSLRMYAKTEPNDDDV